MGALQRLYKGYMRAWKLFHGGDTDIPSYLSKLKSCRAYFSQRY